MEEILKSLNIDYRLIDIAMGRIRIYSEDDMYHPANEYIQKGDFPAPPFLIPLIVSYDADHYYTGVIKHWFSYRELSYGDATGALQFLTNEIARTPEQFFLPIIYRNIENEDCQLSSYIVDAALKLGINNLEEIMKYVKQNKYSEFKNLIFSDDDNVDSPIYKGTFPSYSLIPPRNFETACFCEITHKELIGYPATKQGFSLFREKSKFVALPNIPEWLKPDTNKSELFDKYISKGEFGKAWLTINGPGFTPKDVAERLQQLKQHTAEKAYHLWADYWCDKYGEFDSFFFM